MTTPGRAFDEIPREEKERTPAVEREQPALPPPPQVDTPSTGPLWTGSWEAITTKPEGFHLNRKLEKGLEQGRRALEEDAVDWALAESWPGEACCWKDGRCGSQARTRGGGRSASATRCWWTRRPDWSTPPLEALARKAENGARFFTLDSLLSEFAVLGAVLGFEYAYSLEPPTPQCRHQTLSFLVALLLQLDWQGGSGAISFG